MPPHGRDGPGGGPLSRFSTVTILAFAAPLGASRAAPALPGSTWLALALMVAVVLVMQTNVVVLGAHASHLWDVQELKRRYPW